MERLLSKKRITTLCFLIALFIFATGNMVKEVPVLAETIRQWHIRDEDLGSLIAEVNTAINENVAGRYYFIDFYGYIQLLLGKNEESNFEVVKDMEGKLHYTYFTSRINDMTEISRRVSALAGAVEESGCKVIYVMPPDKYIKGYTWFPKGIPYNMVNESTDDFLERLDGYGIDSIDLRDYLWESGIRMQDVFYRTDHHWRVETAFWAASEFCDILNERYGENLDADGRYKDLSHYNQITYEKIFLGSMGRKTGRFYTQVDDFTLIYPKFSTDYIYGNSKSDDLEFNEYNTFTGRFEESLIATPVIRESNKPFDADLYGSYLYGNPGYVHIENLGQEDGIDICIIKDSFAVPFAAFTSLRCHEVDLLDPRYFEGDYIKTINEGNYDYVLIMISPQNLTVEFFPYCG